MNGYESFKAKIMPTSEQVTKTIVCAAIAGVAGLFVAKLIDIGYDKAVEKIRPESAESQQ